MAKILGWLVGWVPRRSATTGANRHDPEDLGDMLGMEAAFAPTRPAMIGMARTAPAPLDTDWAIRRLNSRSHR